MVDCGGHFEYDCSSCPRGHGAVWCNGDCAWVSTLWNDGQCVPGWPGAGGDSSDFYDYFMCFIFSGTVMLIYACVYHQKVIKGPPPLPQVNSVLGAKRRGLFECFKYPDLCMYITFCMPVVAGKNYYATDVCPFWPGCILTYLGTYSPFYCITAFVRAVLSGRVQDKLRIEHWFPYDCLVALFCFPCDVGRESLEVDEEIGARIECCCKVHYKPRPVAEVVTLVEKSEEAVERSCDGVGRSCNNVWNKTKPRSCGK